MPDRLNLTGLIFVHENRKSDINAGLVQALREAADYLDGREDVFVMSMSIEPYEPRNTWSVVLYIDEAR